LESPLERILDIGTGTGVWAIDMATLHPEAEMIATDLTRMEERTDSFNGIFWEIDDAENEWTWPDVGFSSLFFWSAEETE
jgi:tRNA A58 N-methylase Trm61